MLFTLALTASMTFAVLLGKPSAALADGGAGGSGGTPDNGAGGAGGIGFTGNPGGIGGTAINPGGGGGGGAGGGAGGTGGVGTTIPSPGGTGGTGGTSGSPNGQNGGDAGDGGGGGGGGGFNGNGTGAATITNTAALTGGSGGAGGSTNVTSGSVADGGGGGGAGGFGAIVTGAGASTNTSTITGGGGGNGGNASGAGLGFTAGSSGNGGDGGVGVQFTTAGATFINSGTVTGGNGGTGGTLGVVGLAGAGGAGIVGSGLTIINSGTISGGLSGDGVTRANVITFTGGTNLLNELAGANLIGNLTIGAGTTITGTGTSTMTGAYTQTAGSTYQVNTAGATSTHLQITGTATITGGTVVASGSGSPGTTFTILTATGGVSGTYSGVSDNVPFTTAALSYDPDDVFLVLSPNPNALINLGQTFNQRSTAMGLGESALAVQVLGLNPSQVPFALDQLSGEIYASNVTAGLENQSLFLRTLAERLRQGRCLCGTDAAAPGCEPDNAWHAWGTPFGQAGKAGDNGNAHGFEYDSVGFAAGADRWLTGDTLIGFALGYDNWANNTDLLGSRSDVNSFLLGLYAYQQIGGGWLLGTVSYENDSYDTIRPIDFLAATARGNYGGNQVGSYLEAGYGIGVGGLQIQPIGAVQYISLWRDAVSESGAGAADLDVGGAHADSFRSYVGGRLVYPLNVAGRCVLPEARAFWVHEYAADTRDINNQFASGGPDFLIYGQNLGRDWGQFGCGLSAQLGDRVRIGLQYDAFVNADSVAHGGMAQMQVRW